MRREGYFNCDASVGDFLSELRKLFSKQRCIEEKVFYRKIAIWLNFFLVFSKT